MAVAKAKAAPRTETRSPSEDRMPPRTAERETLAADPSGPILSRSGKPVELRFTGGEDKFAFDRSIVPEGWDYQWKRKTIKGFEDSQHMTEMEANGWEPVPAERHDGVFMPRGHKGHIERGGQILMERDLRLTMRARAMDERAANEAVRNSRSPVGLAGTLMNAAPGAANILDLDRNQGVGVKIERVPMGNPNRSAGYTYTLDE